MHRMKKKMILCLTLLAVLSLAFSGISAKSQAAPSAYDLIAAVNALRVNNGLAELPVNASLMAAAQGQSDYLASIYPNIVNGHAGPGGNRAVDRAIAAGYPVGSDIRVLECWAYAVSSVSLDTIIYSQSFWNDSAHMGVMLHQHAVEVGAGVTEADGRTYYILNVAIDWGYSGGDGGVIPTFDLTPEVVPVEVATPHPDGSIIHTVQAGQALWSIAIAYDVTVERLRLLNNLSENAVIYEGQELLIRLASTPTSTATITATPRPPTRTPIPAHTPEAMITPAPAGNTSSLLGSINLHTLGLVLILVCGMGLVLILLQFLSKKK